MSFDSPSSLYWLGLIVPIVIFYILKIRLRRQTVSTVMFWNQVLEEQNPRSIWQRLRHLVSLLLQLALLALLVFALADPYFFWEIRAARRIVVVIDHSASMNATDIKPSRLNEAKRQTASLMAGMRHRDEMALIAAGTQPQVLVGFTGRRRMLEDALDQLPPTDGPSHVAEAIALGERLLGERQDGKRQEVIVYTDGCFADSTTFTSAATVAASTSPPTDSASSQRDPDAPRISLRIIAEATNNLGITQFQVRRSLVDPLGYQILAEVTNFSDVAVETRLEIELISSTSHDSQPIDVVPLKLEPGAKWSQVFDQTSADGGELIGRLNFDDALTSDNVARAVLPRRETQPVLLVTAGNLYLQKVFEANPLVKLTVVAEPPETIPAGTLVVYHRLAPEKLPAGNLFVIDPANSSDLYTVGEQLENAIVTKQDKDSPLMAHVRLFNVLMPEARKLVPLLEEQAKVLASSVSTDPLFFSVERPTGKVLVLTVNLEKEDLPLRTAFPIMVGNALHWFAGNKGDLRESLATGSVTTVTAADFQAPSQGRELTLVSPSGTTKKLPVGDQSTLGPLDECGIWTIQPITTKSEIATSLFSVACNLANANESDIRPAESLLAQRSVTSPMMAGLGSHPLWFWLLLLGLMLTTLEWRLYQRRVIS